MVRLNADGGAQNRMLHGQLNAARAIKCCRGDDDDVLQANVDARFSTAGRSA